MLNPKINNGEAAGSAAHHVATALEAGREELITFDDRILKYAEQFKELGMRVIKANETQPLPKELPEREAREMSDAERGIRSELFDLFGAASDLES